MYCVGSEHNMGLINLMCNLALYVYVDGSVLVCSQLEVVHFYVLFNSRINYLYR